MKLALVTTPRSIRSGIGDYTRSLVGHLREHASTEIFVQADLEGEDYDGQETRSAADLDPREFDQIVYQLGNEMHHGFMARMVRELGGTVVQHDWVLFDMALSAFPALARGGLKGHLLALREGGAGQTLTYSRNWLRRRRQRLHREGTVDAREIEGTLLAGWHLPEPEGTWTGDLALFRVPSASCDQVRIQLETEPGRRVRLLSNGRSCAEFRSSSTESSAELCLTLDRDAPREVAIETSGIQVSADQRRHGDTRRLGSFVRGIGCLDRGLWLELSLSSGTAHSIRTVGLSTDRFSLSLNRSIVRHADSFIVHSEYLKRRILQSRNAYTDVGVVHHGAERLWEEGNTRAEARHRLGLDEDWRSSFLAVSFGAVQPHKRIGPLLDALARARSTNDRLRLVIVGRLFTEEYDAVEAARSRDLLKVVRFTGYASEDDAREWLRACDVAVNLRGPSSGGTSGGAFRAFSMGRAVIATDAAEQCELPESCVLRAPLGDGEVEFLAKTLVELAVDPSRLERLEAGAREFVEHECHWSLTARKYVEFLKAFPPPRSARKSLISRRVGQGLRVKERRAAGK